MFGRKLVYEQRTTGVEESLKGATKLNTGFGNGNLHVCNIF